MMLMLFLGSNVFAKGYRIVLPAEKGDTAEYLLSGWKWGDKVALDTVMASKGKISFRGKSDLACGSYEISELSGRKLVEFIVPRENRNFGITFQKEGESYTVKRGNAENRLFSGFLYFLDYGWEGLGSAEEFAQKIEEFRNRAATELPGTITDIILGNTLFTPESAEELRESFPFGDTIILNTQFAEDKVEQYLGLLQYNHNDTIIKYVDSLIACGGNRELQGRLAHTAYDFFYNSSIMGQEGVAVHIAQNWFLNDLLEWPDAEGKFMLRTFVEFNRHSLIGMDAPELELTDTLGKKVPLHSLDAEYTIVYFYTDDCVSCRKETPKLVDFVNGYDQGVLAVYAVYADGNEQRWKEYINSNLYIYNPFMEWVNVYDPEYESGFQMLYNVIKTPQMFLLDKEKKIIGRGLDVKALAELLAAKNAERDRTRELIEMFFAPLAGDTLQIYNGIDMFYNSSKGDTGMMKEFMQELYNTLGRSEDYTLQQGAVYVAKKYMLGMPDFWSAEFLEKRKEDVRIFNMNRLGSVAADLDLERADGSSLGLFDVTTDYKVLYFYRPNCGVCAEVTPKMAAIYNEFKEKIDIEIFAINLGKGYEEWINYFSTIGADWENVRGTDGDSSEIYRRYHLQNIPAIYLLKGNVVVAKNINDNELKNILNNITQ